MTEYFTNGYATLELLFLSSFMKINVTSIMHIKLILFYIVFQPRNIVTKKDQQIKFEKKLLLSPGTEVYACCIILM